MPWVPREPSSGGLSGLAPALSRPQDGTVHLVYGILEQPFPSLEAINTSALQTGLQRVQLLKPDIAVPPLPPDTRTMEVRAPDVLVPSQETTYWCYVTELPGGFSRHHIVMVRGGPGPVPAPPATRGLGETSRSWSAARGPGRAGRPEPKAPLSPGPLPPSQGLCAPASQPAPGRLLSWFLRLSWDWDSCPSVHPSVGPPPASLTGGSTQSPVAGNPHRRKNPRDNSG